MACEDGRELTTNKKIQYNPGYGDELFHVS